MIKKMLAIIIAVMVGTIIGIPSLISLASTPNLQEVEEEMPTWSGPEIKLLLTETGEIVTLPLEQYLIGVIAAEMPASFELEALKAQAVAARTYTLKRMLTGNDRHPEAHICDDFNHCQAWMSTEAMVSRWGMTNYATYKVKIKRAVEDTLGLILTYDNQLIEPVYHSTSGPYTENSEAVWQKAVPYLRSVPSPWSQHSPRYQEEKHFTWAELDKLLKTNLSARPAAALASNNSLIQIADTTATGRVCQLRLGDKTLPAVEVRRRLGLNSTNFRVTTTSHGVTFTTTGFGHGVGMCQYGANGMAKEGKSFQEILTHYYTGVEIRKMTPSQ